MSFNFADRIKRAPVSFLSELFSVSNNPSIISFAGGLPSSALIDTKGIAQATRQVMEEEAHIALQYTTTDGYLPLREYIADRYRTRLGLTVTAAEIQIVNGSQQCLDLFAKIFLNKGDHVGMERPGYLGAIEAFSLYEPVIDTVPLQDDGPDLALLDQFVKKTNAKFFYGIPNSQNPSGRTYSQEKRRAIADILRKSNTVFYEDDAFGELFFDTKPRMPVMKISARPERHLRLIFQDHRTGYANRLDLCQKRDPCTVQCRQAGSRPAFQFPLPEDPAPVPYNTQSR